MRGLILLHMEDGDPVLVNPDQIQTVHESENGSIIYLAGEDDGMSVTECMTEIDRKIVLS